MKIIKTIISSLLMLTLTACIYPVYRTVQPATKVMVVDKENRAIKEAKVNLIIREYYPFVRTVKKRKTDSLGIVKFESIKKWGTDMRMIHGIKPSNAWSLCIEKSNYVTQYMNIYNEEKSKNPTVTLLEGESTVCAERDNREVTSVSRRKYFFALFAVDEETAMNVENMSTKDAEALGDVILTSWKNPSVKYLIKNKFIINRFMIADAQAFEDEIRQEYLINVQFTKEGAKVFSDFTAKNVGNRIAIVLNDIVYSTPVIYEQIRGGKVYITANFSKEKAFEIVNSLNFYKRKN